jgi:restriction endonuclease Mrr
MSKPRSPQVYAVPNRTFAKGEGERVLNKMLKNPPEQGEEVKVILPILKQLNPFVFEEVLLQALERWKYHVIRTEKQTKDNGIDGSFAYGGYFYVIQAKLYGSEPNPDHLGMFANAMSWHQAAWGFFFHTGRATDAFKLEAERYAAMIEVVSGTKLVSFLLGRQTLFLRKPLTGFPERSAP